MECGPVGTAPRVTEWEKLAAKANATPRTCRMCGGNCNAKGKACPQCGLRRASKPSTWTAPTPMTGTPTAIAVGPDKQPCCPTARECHHHAWPSNADAAQQSHEEPAWQCSRAELSAQSATWEHFVSEMARLKEMVFEMRPAGALSEPCREALQRATACQTRLLEAVPLRHRIPRFTASVLGLRRWRQRSVSRRTGRNPWSS
jgi:hypothetical protein